jgi:FixJ family two-component response regulator
MPQIPPLIAIVDDDPSLRTALTRWLRAVGWQAVAFASAEAFLQADPRRSVGCLLLDLELPGMSGLALLEHLEALDSTLSVIVITGREDVLLRLPATQTEVVAYLRKPLDEQALLQALQRAMGQQASEGT